jgi:hypothetical protein
MSNFHVFLSYDSNDSLAVEKIATSLRDRGLKIWLDIWELRPGMGAQANLEKALKESGAMAVFVGSHGLGPWEEIEMRAALHRQVLQNYPVIPVLLPGVANDIEAKLSPFLRNNTWVVFKETTDYEAAIDSLVWGITGVKPERSKSTTHPKLIVSTSDPVDDAIAKIIGLLIPGNVTYFLGPGSSYGRVDSLPRPCDISRELLSELRLINLGYDQLLPPVDIAGMYYAVKSGDTNLETRVIDINSKSAGHIPATHHRLAELLELLLKRPARRVRYKTRQLIVTTSLDLMMERVLLRKGISFTRLVQHRSGQRIDINEYRAVRLVGNDTVQIESGTGLIEARLDHVEELDEVIAASGRRSIEIGDVTIGGANALHGLALQSFTEPLLYKFLGSYDVPKSCSLSAEQHFEFAQRQLRQNCVPAQITEIIANSPLLFFGHSFLDPDFRLASVTLLKKSLEIETEPRYAIQLSPDHHKGDIYRQMESGIWTQIKEYGSQKLKITTLEVEGDQFLEKLTSELRVQLRL